MAIQRFARRQIWISLLAAVSAPPVLADGEDLREVTRSFLMSPPRFESLVLRRTLSVGPLGFRTKREAQRFLERVASGQASIPGATSIYELRYQAEPPSFLLRSLPGVEEVDRWDAPRQEPFAGRYGSNWWAIRAVVPGQVHLLNSVDGREVTGDGRTNAYYWGNERWATEYLRLGMFDILPSTLEWDAEGWGFRAATEDGALCRGLVLAGEAEGTARIRLERVLGQPAREIRIDYVRESARWLPAVIEVDHLSDKREASGRSRYATLEALAWRISEHELPREVFSPEPYLRTNDLWVEVQGGQFYLLHGSPTGAVRELVREEERIVDQWRGIVKYGYLAGALTVGWLLLRAYILGWRARNRGVVPGK